MYAQLSARRDSALPREALHMRPSEAAGILGVVLLMAAFLSPEHLRVLPSAAGFLALAAFRLAAARDGWARRGAGW
ncbi:MAG TPA: hypothetical protein VF042_09605 [Gemmatimonadaceae bacterium]